MTSGDGTKHSWRGPRLRPRFGLSSQSRGGRRGQRGGPAVPQRREAAGGTGHRGTGAARRHRAGERRAKSTREEKRAGRLPAKEQSGARGRAGRGPLREGGEAVKRAALAGGRARALPLLLPAAARPPPSASITSSEAGSQHAARPRPGRGWRCGPVPQCGRGNKGTEREGGLRRSGREKLRLQPQG